MDVKSAQIRILATNVVVIITYLEHNVLNVALVAKHVHGLVVLVVMDQPTRCHFSTVFARTLLTKIQPQTLANYAIALLISVVVAVIRQNVTLAQMVFQ